MTVAAMPPVRPEAALSRTSTIRVALLPALMVLGLQLPLAFLTRVDEYLYYLRPSELVPTYATAWLLLAAVAMLPTLIAIAVLGTLRKLDLKRLQHWTSVALFFISGYVVVFAVLFDIVEFFLTFSPGTRGRIAATLGIALAVISVVPAALLARSFRGREAIAELRTTAVSLTLLGAAFCLALPLFRWSADAAPTALQASMADPPPARPNILLLSIDALSAQHMSLYGAARPTTPGLDAFARGAVVFDRAYANANFTTPGVASILTATRPWTHRAFQIFSWATPQSRRASLPAVLSQAGYLTGYVGTNSYAGASRGGFGPYFSFGRGDLVPLSLPCPDRVAAWLPYECPAAQIPPLVSLQKLWNRLQTSFPFWRENRHYDPQPATQAALTWLAGVKQRPVFLWLHLFPPHAPYATPAPWLGRFSASMAARDPSSSDPDDNYVFAHIPPERVEVLAARYDESVQYVDHYAAQFLTAALKLLGDNTIVVIVADHGESFAHGYGGHGGPGLFDSIIHVPLIIKLPGQTQAVRVAAPVEQVDIAPTLLRLIGMPIPPSWEGRALLGGEQGGDRVEVLPLRPIFTMNFEENSRRRALTTGSIAVIEGQWKLLHYMGALHYPQMPELHDELYDLLNDPQETANQSQAQPQELQHLRGVAAAALARYGGAEH